MVEQLQQLLKALEAGSYNAAPGTLSQGSALQKEDLSTVMHNVTWADEHIKLQKMLDIRQAKGNLIQVNRRLSYGDFGTSAQFEGGVGEETTSDINRIVFPMAYYSTVKRVTVVADTIATFNGESATDMEADAGAKILAGDIEFDSFRGQEEFSNAGVFDGNPLAVAKVPNMVGLGQQIRMSDYMSNAQDLMFNEFGGNQSVVLSAGGGTLTQSLFEDMSIRSKMGQGNATAFVTDPIALSAYNKIAHAKERIMLAGNAIEQTGAQLRRQQTSAGLIMMEDSRFLSGKTQPARSREGAPSAPSVSSAHTGTNGIIEAGSYKYYVTAVSMRGESAPSSVMTVPVAAGERVELTITAVSGAAYYNVYRSLAGGTAASAKFIGRIAQAAGNPVFIDLGNRTPGATTAYLLQKDTMALHQLSAYTRLKLPMANLAFPEAHYRFVCLGVHVPRKNVLAENIKGTF